MAPLSEIYGRVPIYHVSNVCYIGFTVGCALAPTLDALIVFRFLAGVFGSTPITNGGGSIADMIAQEHRAKAMAGFSIGPLLGPIIGPVAGGFLADAAGWRWVFWLLVILGGVQTTTSMIFMRETFAPVLLQRRVDKLKKETGNMLLRSKLDAGLSPRDYFKRGIIRPLKLLAFSPITQIFAVYMAIVYVRHTCSTLSSIVKLTRCTLQRSGLPLPHVHQLNASLPRHLRLQYQDSRAGLFGAWCRIQLSLFQYPLHTVLGCVWRAMTLSPGSLTPKATPEPRMLPMNTSHSGTNTNTNQMSQWLASRVPVSYPTAI